MKHIYMMLISLLLLLNVSSAQDKEIYTGGKIAHSDKPLGRDVKLVYDTYFKNYTVTFTNSRGQKQQMVFEYDSPGVVTLGYAKYEIMGVLKYGVITFYQSGYSNSKYTISGLTKK